MNLVELYLSLLSFVLLHFEIVFLNIKCVINIIYYLLLLYQLP